MILSYRDKRTSNFAQGRFVREFQGFARQAYRRLEVLDAAGNLDELRMLRSNRLEALKP
jgi:proteic killer suppression protein